MQDHDIISAIGRCDYRGDRRGFGIKRADRRQHLYLIGQTGTGKSTALANLIIQDLQRGEGLALIDPHGDLAETVLNYVPASRTNQVIYFDPADQEFPVGFNILETVPPEHPRFVAEKTLVASGLISVFHMLWRDSWGPRLEHILRNTVLALLDTPGSTLLGVLRLLSDDEFRQQVVGRVRDPIVKAFWTEEFDAYSATFRAEAVAPIQNKVGQFLSTSMLRNILGQPRSTINLRELMDQGGILIMNLAKGRIGEDNSALLGAMMITKLQLAAMSRADLAPEARRDFYLFVDEAQSFLTDSFATILSESRKVRLCLTAGNQYLAQLSERLRDAIFGNVGTLVSFRVGGADADYLEKEFGPEFGPEDFVRLDNYHAYIKLLVDGAATRPFSMVTTPLPPHLATPGRRETILRVSRERYARRRVDIEQKVARWAARADEAPAPGHPPREPLPHVPRRIGAGATGDL